MRGVLERALAAAEKESVDVLTHNLHPWPARMHPFVARVVLEGLSAPGDTLLDPFSGSGTTLVEAQRLGLACVGLDLNPLARRVAEVKCRVTSAADRERSLHTLAALVESSHARVKERRPARAPLPPPEARRYEGHVLKELAGLWEEIQALEGGIDKRSFEVLLSAIVVKFSKQRSDTAHDEVSKRIGRHVPTGFFERRGQELVERWALYAEEVPPKTPRVKVLEGDARHLARALREQTFSVVLTSPPYGGTYDYVEHHARRFPWLGLDARAFEKREMGARRRLSEGEGAEAQWQGEVRAFLSSLAKVTNQGSLSVLVLGDADVGGLRVDAEEQLQALAPSCGFSLVAAASEARQDWRGGRTRREHLLALRRLTEGAASPRDEAGGPRGAARSTRRSR